MSTPVVIADDNEDAAAALAGLLNILGYDTIVAYDGRQAVTACLETKPALAILDVEMPQLDGCQAADLIKHQASPAPWMTSLSGANLDEEPWATKCQVFDSRLTKPVRLEELLRLLLEKVGSP